MAKRDPLLISALQLIRRNATAESMDQRVDVSFRRGATEIDLLSHTFPGLQFTDVSYSDDLNQDPGDERVHIHVIGSGADLVRHGFLEAGLLEVVARIKTRKVLRDADNSCIEVERRVSGFRVRRRVPLDMIAAALAPRVWVPKTRLARS
jgi:hypothetical protein